MAKLTQEQQQAIAAIRTAFWLRKEYEQSRGVGPSQPQIFIANLLDIIATLQAPEPAPAAAPVPTDGHGDYVRIENHPKGANWYKRDWEPTNGEEA